MITPQARAEILTRWKAGIGKRDIAIVLRLPFDEVCEVITADTNARRAPKTRPQRPIEELIVEAEAGRRQRTRSLAARARAVIAELTDAVRLERERELMERHVKTLAAELDVARKALRETAKETR